MKEDKGGKGVLSDQYVELALSSKIQREAELLSF